MKKTNIIVIVTAIVIIAGYCANGIILRNKYLNEKFDDPFSVYVKNEFTGVTSVKITNWPGEYLAYYTGETSISYSDSINELISKTKEEIFHKVEGTTLNVWKLSYGRTQIKISDLKTLEARNNQILRVVDFTEPVLDILACDSVNVTLSNCKIENLNLHMENHAQLTVDSTCVINNVNLILKSHSTYASQNIEYRDFTYDIDETCGLNFSGKSLKVLVK